MLIKKYNSIMEQPEAHRNKWALGLTVTLTVIIFFSFAFYRGFVSFGGGGTMAGQKPANQMASVASVLSPIESSKTTFKTAFDEIEKQYQDFKDSISDVFVPFIEGIDVYERE